MKEIISRAVDTYQLTELIAIYEKPDRAVYSADSAIYGPVILKASKYMQLREEYNMLRQLKGNGCCKVYVYDEQNGFLLEERVIPGIALREEADLNRRILVLKDVFYKIHITNKIHDGTDECIRKSYLDWLTDVNTFFKENDINHDMAKKVALATQICMEMFQKYPERLLLHGDLHHDNILQCAEGSYVMIDPKGVIGPEILDLPRFIMNELETKHVSDDEEHMMNAVRLVSKTFKYPILDIAKVYFMEVILGNAWCMEDGDEINENEIAIAERILFCGVQYLDSVLCSYPYENLSVLEKEEIDRKI